MPAYYNYCRHLGHSEYTCEIRLKEEEKKKRKGEVVAEISNSQDTNQKKSKDEAGTNINQKKEQGGMPKSDTQYQRKIHKTEEYQNVVTEITEEEWQNQKRKNFKGTTQSKRHQKFYMPKHPNNQ